ncbi:hypothetical protein EW026_g770 [Hermanssonia centrifuga]|uniref:Double-strand break repair protein n=1 Tax=Hermanssonia centrifuga TaxID=98765 RepID=A0A4S4KTN0_9APHY|nr:hypothetical protein EW026_g770 [Hermanssonia centrifuga]
MELLSDPDEGKASGYSFPAVNYEDPNLNIGMPVFSIHGNHDDPQGAGPEGALCALDMLSVSGLINYMGKIDLPLNDAEAQDNGISIKPILLRKGKTKLALYGVGNVKDTRMHFELRSNRVHMFMPKDKDDWFNVFLLHQNRVPHGPQQSVPEGMFDNSIDLVVWGHEHDCRIDPEVVAGKRYRICQPGSSVATSLSDGEALEKQVAILEIHGKDYAMKPITLQTVRPFVLDEMRLSDVADAGELDLNDRAAITQLLKDRVNELIEQAKRQWEERNERARREGDEELPPMLPLIRLKVDTTGVSEMTNPARFGQEFQGRIANPRDVLVFHRSKKINRGGKIVVEQPELSIDDPELTTSEKLSRVRVETLVQEYLAAQELQVLAQLGMSDAIETFVDKDDIHAITTHVVAELKDVLKSVQAKGGNVELEEENVEELVGEVRQENEQRYLERRQTGRSLKPKAKGKGKADSDAESVDSMMIDVDIGGSEFDEEPAPKKPAARGRKTAAAPAKKAPARKGKKKAVSSDEEEEEEEEEEEDQEQAPAPVKRTNRAAVLSQTTAKAKRAPAKKTAAAAASSKQGTLSFAPSQRATGTRAAATRGRKKTAEVVDLDSDD